MTDRLRGMLERPGWLLADGATGTSLFALGLAHGEAPEAWNLEHPDRVRAHYRSFIEAGSDLVLTNSFGGTANRLRLHGLEGRVEEISEAAARLLAEEIAASGRDVVCAGDMGPTGDLFAPVGPLSHDAGVAAFEAQMRGLKRGGAELVWIETMSSEAEYLAALEAADRVGLPAVGTMSFDTNGRTMMGVTPARLAEVVRGCGHPPLGWGGNCGTGAPDLLIGLLSLQGMIGEADIVVAKANCGIPEFVDGAIRYSGTAGLMADYAVMARDLGAKIIGGCCGTEPGHVTAMREALETRPAGPAPTAEEILMRIGPVTGNTLDLLQGGGAGPRPAPRRRRRGGAG
ncbi:MAG: betaine--homocysteine S-methyltransferase [Pseudomonadota bacterium]